MSQDESQRARSSCSPCGITSPHGTDVTYRLGVYPTVSEYGYTDQPGRWDHWPAAFVSTGGADAAAARSTSTTSRSSTPAS